MSDSHLELPVVKAKLAELDARDFAPFRVLSDMPMAMTAHVVYTAIDRRRPATTSKKAIKKIIRESLGFDGLLMSDDLSMKALSGDFKQRAKDSLSAGCDVVLHCNGDMDEMKAVMSGVGGLSKEARRRSQAVMSRLVKVVEPLDVAEARARFDAAFANTSYSGRFA
jgi:beta-N-acetylhexosaminidase